MPNDIVIIPGNKVITFQDGSNTVQRLSLTGSGLRYTGEINARSLTGSNGGIFSGSVKSTNTISGLTFNSTQSSGDEGGEIVLNKPATNTNITSSVTIDVYQNKLRIFKTGGTNRSNIYRR